MEPKKVLTAAAPLVAGLVIAGSLGFASPAPRLLVNGQLIKSDVPAKIENGRTLVPIRVVSEALGAQVSYNEDTNTVSITMPPRYPLLKLNGEPTTWPYWYEDGGLYLEHRNAVELLREYYHHPAYSISFFKDSGMLSINTASYQVPTKHVGDFTLVSLDFLLNRHIINYDWDAKTGNLTLKPF